MTLAKNIELLEDPLDTVEMVASIRDWTYERSDNEVSIIAKGQWSDYQISVTWVDDFEGINIVCGFDLKFQERHKNNILNLVSSINNQMWLGHFDIWIEEGIVLYRNTSLFNRNKISQNQFDEVMVQAVTSCDQFFPAFQYVLWANKSPSEALEAVLFNTQGEA